MGCWKKEKQLREVQKKFQKKVSREALTKVQKSEQKEALTKVEKRRKGDFMARVARLKAEESGDVFYHLYSRVAGVSGYYPLGEKLARAKLIWLFKFYSNIYRVKIAGFSIMGNHYHLVVEFEEFKKLDREELKKIALKMYSRDSIKLGGWTAEKWERFNRRIFDVSEFMRNVQAAFARWFNDKNHRKGRFWGDRFKSTLLEDEKAMRDCLYYVELNALRAGIVARPEEYCGCSLFFREIKDDRFMMSLKTLMNAKNRATAMRDYKASIYYRGNVRSKTGQQEIPDYIIKQEEALGFESQGIYAKRARHFVDGLVIGSSDYIESYLSKLKQTGQYLRRKNPIKSKNEDALTLREQRTTEVHIH